MQNIMNLSALQQMLISNVNNSQNIAQALKNYQMLLQLKKGNPEMFSTNNLQDTLINSYFMKVNNPNFVDMMKQNLI